MRGIEKLIYRREMKITLLNAKEMDMGIFYCLPSIVMTWEMDILLKMELVLGRSE